MKKSVFLGISITLAFTLLFIACRKEIIENDDVTEIIGPITSSEQAVFVLSHSPSLFQSDGYKTSMSIYYPESSKVYENVFLGINGSMLNYSFPQFMNIINNKIYISVLEENRIQICDMQINAIGSIENLEFSQQIIGIDSNRAYISFGHHQNIDSAGIRIVNLQTNEVTKKIKMGYIPNEMLLYQNKEVFVLDWSNAKKIDIIDIATDEIKTSIPLNFFPISMQLDKNNKLWVLCAGSGKTDDLNYTHHLLRVNSDDHSTELDISFNSTFRYPEQLIINETKDILYFVHSFSVFKFSIDSTHVPEDPLIKGANNYAGTGVLAYNPISKKIYYTLATDDNSGSTRIYNSESGEQTNSFSTPGEPKYFYFFGCTTNFLF